MLRGRPPRRGLLLPPALRRPAALVLAGCVAVTALLALTVSRQARPDALDAAVDARILEGYQSFPSGHATALFGLAATGSVLLANPPRPRLPRQVRLLLVLAAALVAATVAVAVVVLRYHYFTDTVAGTAVGIGMVLLTALILDRAGPVAASRARRIRQG